MTRVIFQRVRSALPAKLLAGSGVLATCAVAYFGLQHFHLGTARLQPECAVSALLPFDPRWTPLYLSMFVMVGVAMLSLRDRGDVVRFAATLLLMEAVAWLFFFLMPTACFRPPAHDAAWMYRVMIGLDAPVNCFPCLHGALTLLAAFVIWGGIGEVATSRVVRWLARSALAAWGAGILVSILILRQHTAVDVAAGLLLGAVTCRCYARLSKPKQCRDGC